MPRFLQVTISSRNGRTTVRAFEDLTQTAGGFMGGLGLGAGAGVGSLLSAITAGATHSPPLIIATLFGSMLAGVGASRLLFGRMSRKKQAELEALVRRIAARVRTMP
jgi:serine/threonine-protein kinase